MHICLSLLYNEGYTNYVAQPDHARAYTLTIGIIPLFTMCQEISMSLAHLQANLCDIQLFIEMLLFAFEHRCIHLIYMYILIISVHRQASVYGIGIYDDLFSVISRIVQAIS